MVGWNEFLSPIVVCFAAVLIGMLVSKIKVCNISLGLSATLIVSLITGYLLNRYIPSVINNTFRINLNFLSKIGAAVFISVIGLISGSTLDKYNSKISIISFVVGVIIVVAGFLSNLCIHMFDASTDKSLMMGIFCGAMTSTPALSSMCENSAIASELVTLGYGIAYPFGVIGVVLFAQFISKEDRIAQQKEPKPPANSTEALIIIAVVSILGNVLGGIEIPFRHISLGATGGTLIAGLLTGIATNVFLTKYDGLIKTLSIYRDLGLVAFFIGNGIIAGERLNTVIQMKWFAYGAIITTTSLLCGYIVLIALKKYVKADSFAFIISGGMTSTPALGAVLSKHRNSDFLKFYSLAYLGALICIMLLSKK